MVGFLGRRTFTILGSFGCLLDRVHGVLQVGFDHKALLRALFHLSYGHAGFADFSNLHTKAQTVALKREASPSATQTHYLRFQSSQFLSQIKNYFN